MLKKVHFNENNTYFYHPPEKELALRKYRNKYSVAWPLSYHYRFEHIIGPVLRKEIRDTILTRNQLAEAIYLITEQIKDGRWTNSTFA
jgi:hypothetical protein